MSAHKGYNAGPVVAFLGHGNTSRQKPPLITILDGFDCLEVVRKYEKGHGYVLYLEDHKAIMRLLSDFAAVCTSNTNTAEILANHLHLMPTAVNHVRHISERFLPPKDDNDILARLPDGRHGHAVVVNNVSYDIRFCDHRVRLIENATSSLHLTEEHVSRIKKFQTEHTSVVDPKDGIIKAWEARERIISHPCGLLWDKKKLDADALPPVSDYISLSYKLRLTDITVSAAKFVNVSVFLSKAALEYDKSVPGDAHLSTYVGFPKICKSSVLSGKHFIFTHLECIKPQCDNHKKPCSTSAFNISNLLNSFISKLHVFVKNINIELSSDIVRLNVADELGAQSTVPPDAAFAYYDFAMPRESTLVLVSCTGHDTVMHDIFGT